MLPAPPERIGDGSFSVPVRGPQHGYCDRMNSEKVVFGFFVLLAATLNFGYVPGEIGNPLHHNAIELYAAVVVNLILAINHRPGRYLGMS